MFVNAIYFMFVLYFLIVLTESYLIFVWLYLLKMHDIKKCLTKLRC